MMLLALEITFQIVLDEPYIIKINKVIVKKKNNNIFWKTFWSSDFVCKYRKKDRW